MEESRHNMVRGLGRVREGYTTCLLYIEEHGELVYGWSMYAETEHPHERLLCC